MRTAVLAWAVAAISAATGCVIKHGTIDQGTELDGGVTTLPDGGSSDGAQSTLDGKAPKEPWTPHASGSVANLRGVFATATHAWAVGEAGTILRSDDHGASWATVASGSTAALNAVWGSDDQDLYAVGEGGTLLHSADGGKTWPAQTSGTTGALYAIWGSSANDVYVGADGATLLRSVDGGKTWPKVGNPAASRIGGIYGTSANDVYAVAESGLFISATGGTTWQTVVTSVSTQYGVWASGPTDIYIANNAGAVTQWDGKTISKFFLGQGVVYGVWGTGANDVYAVGEHGTIAHSTTGWDGFYLQDSKVTTTLRAVGGAAGQVYAVGDTGIVLTRF